MKNIIACVDGSAISGSVCDAAAWAALKLNAPLTLLHALEKETSSVADNLSGAIGFGTREHLLSELTELDAKRSKIALEHGKHILEQAKNRAIEEGVEQVHAIQRHGDVLASLVDLETHARVYVLGRAGAGHSDTTAAHVGSHIETIARRVQTPILVALEPFVAPKNFMIAYDGRETADKVIDRVMASDLLKGLPCHLVMVDVGRVGQAEKLAQAVLLLQQKGFHVSSKRLSGDIHTVLKQYQEIHKIDLLVMGAFAHSKVRQFFVGSNTLKMIANSHVPLLILKG